MSTDGDGLRERLHGLFLEELDQHVERLRLGVEDLAGAAPDVPRATVEDLFRAAHSLKGAAQAVGAAVVAGLCHGVEESLAGVREGTIPVDADLLARIGEQTDAIAEAGRTLREQVAPARPAGPADPASAEPGPDPARETGTVRLAAQKLDTLLAEAGSVMDAIHRSEAVTRDLAAARDRLTHGTHGWRNDVRTVRRLLNGSGGADGAAGALARLEGYVGEITEELDRLARAAGAQQRSLQGAAGAFAAAAHDARTVPVGDATAGLTRLVRELCERTGKKMRLVLDTADLEVDRSLVPPLRVALGHLVRNAVDHGVEAPADRERTGKPATGTVRVTATLLNNGIEVVVADDGRGVSADEVRGAARRLGLDLAEELDVDEVLFRPGFSTAPEGNPFSGRGVGLDAVRDAAEAAGGAVQLWTEAGRGTRVSVTVPLTLSSLRVVVVRVGEDLVAVPSSAVRTLVRLDVDRPGVDGRDLVDLGAETVPVAHLADVLGWPSTRTAGSGGHEQALVLDADEGALAVVVTELLDERETVLRAIPPRLAGLSLLLGTTQLEDGTVAIVLSPNGCVRAGLTGRHGTSRPAPTVPAQAPRVLLAEDTLTTRELERSILELAGYSVVVAPDGAQAWQLLQNREVDAVVSDVDMPRMDGVALCRAIRGSQRLADLPVILVTSLHSEADRMRGLDAGADAYLAKTGFDRAELLDALERLL